MSIDEVGTPLTSIQRAVVVRARGDRAARWLARALVATFTLVTLIPFRDYVLDDAYITFRYVQNLAHGDGFVYNPGDRILGTSTPGYVLVLASLHAAVPLDPPRLSWFGAIGATIAAGILFQALLRTWLPARPALIGAVLLVTNPVLSASTGMETSLYVLLIVAFVLLVFDGRHPRLAGVVGGIAVAVRPDAALLFVLVFVAWAARKIDGRNVVATVVAAVATLAPWLLFATWYFGSPVPRTLIAKQRAYGNLSEDFLRGLWHIPALYLNQSDGFVLFAILVVLGMRAGLTGRPPPLLGLLLWAALYLGSFEALGIPYVYIWYWAPLQLPLVALVATGLAWLQRLPWPGPTVPRARRDALLLSLAAGLIVLDLTGSYLALDWNARYYAYPTVGEYLRAHTAPADTVATWEIGVIGYTCRCRVLDLFGLVSPIVVARGPSAAVTRVRPLYLVNGSMPGYDPETVIPVTARHGLIDTKSIVIYRRH